MSTTTSSMLKTAAMTLLSKTLQTFLSKYLSDVDVEGVDLPSVYDGSRWGVRLSNVQLREGVQLVERLPGTKWKKKKRKKQKSSKTKNKSKQKQKNNNDKGTKREQQQHGFDFTADEDDLPPLQDRGDIEEEMSMSLHHMNENDDDGNMRPTRSRTTSTDHLAVPLDDNDDEGSATTSRPSTPLQDSKSIFSCFTKKATTKSSAGDNGTMKNTIPISSSSMDDDYDDDIVSSNNNKQQLPVSVIVKKNTPYNRQISALAMEEKRDGDQIQTVLLVDDDKSKEENESESEEEDELDGYEQSYRLCLGDKGRIGTLDIRLIGRELHVMVEDAFLTIEAFPIPEFPADDGDGKDGDQATTADPQVKFSTEDAGSAVSGTASCAPTPAAPAPPPKPKTAEPKRETVGDRVLADNPLARAIAAIPHLFLRDIRIRFIIRDEPQAQRKPEGGAGTTTTEESSIPNSNHAYPGDTMLEVGIEFLSVNSGEDVLSHFQQRTDDESERADADAGVIPTAPPLAAIPKYSSVETPLDDNEYMTRHIRTGRGPAAGIWVQIFAPGPKIVLPTRSRPGGIDELRWARQHWVLATDFHLLRCSGLDVRARIHLGEKKQVAGYSWFYDYEEDDYDYYHDDSLDSLVLGFDSIAPGPQLPLPPMNPHMSRGSTPNKSNGRSSNGSANPLEESDMQQTPALHPGSDKYTRDANGIQSCRIPSTFHRISRGMLPGSCKSCTHLPSSTCQMCWEGPASVKADSTLDAAMPMPGLALQITLRDPLEINLDRSSLDTLHLLKTIFVKKREKDHTTHDGDPSSENHRGKSEKSLSRASSTLDDATKTTASTSSYFGFLSSKKKEPEKEIVVSDVFSGSMQPENIQVLGIHFSETILRLHVMRGDLQDDGFSFCYWDMLASCLTIDQQTFKSEEKVSQDLRFDVGYFAWNELRGVDCKRLVSLGIAGTARDGSESPNFMSTTSSLLDDHSRNMSPWPSAACALMNIPPPQETLLYKDREHHGIQMRFVSVNNPLDSKQAERIMVNVRLGVTTTKVPWGFWRDINDARKQITWSILGRPDLPNDAPTPKKQSDESKGTSAAASSIMTYSVQMDGGSLVMDPVINLSMPLTRFAGERSSEAGISFEAILHKLEIAYGKAAPVKYQVLSLQQLAQLPENVRSRILFCLDDLSPLEEALELKKLSNPFKRTLAVNKGILKMAKKLSKSSSKSAAHGKGRTLKRSSTDAAPTRRQEIMTDLMKLNNAELDELWAVYQRHQRKLVKKRAGSDHGNNNNNNNS